MAFDVSSVKTLDQSVITIHTPDGEPTDATLTILSLRHKDLKAIDQKHARQRLKKFKSTQKAMADALERQDELALEKVMAGVVGWDNIALQGETLEFSKENLARLLKEADWIKDVVFEAWADEENFFVHKLSDSLNGSKPTLKQTEILTDSIPTS